MATPIPLLQPTQYPSTLALAAIPSFHRLVHHMCAHHTLSHRPLSTFVGMHTHTSTVMVRPPFFPFLSLSVPCPISITFRLHPPSSACLLPPLLQLRGVLMQLCYIHTRTSLRLTSDLLRPDPHTKGYCLYTSYNLSDPFFIINNR